MKKILKKLDLISKKFKKKRLFPDYVIEQVCGKIKAAFKSNQDQVLSDRRIEDIRSSLILKRDPWCDESIRNFSCYNDFASELNSTRIAQCNFLNLPLKAKRHLILHLDRTKLNQIKKIQVIREYLNKLPSPELAILDQQAKKKLLKNIKKNGNHLTKEEQETNRREDIFLEEIDISCSFMAASVIFGVMAFPKFHLMLAKLQIKDVSVEPVAIKIPFVNSETFYRYFLPFPASAYLLRYCLYYEDRFRKIFGRRLRKKSDLINQVALFPNTEFAALFKRWTEIILTLSRHEDCSGLTPAEFYKAALATVVTDNHKNVNLTYGYPSFILACHSKRFKSYSLADRYLEILSNRFSKPSPARATRLQKKSRSLEIDSPLKEAIEKISAIRMRLETKYVTEISVPWGQTRPPKKYLQKWTASLKERKEAALTILDVVEKYKDELSCDDYVNLKFYSKWFASMLRNSKFKKMTTINDYASMIPTLLLNLSTKGAIDRIDSAFRDECFRQTMIEYHNKSIFEHIKMFCQFIKQDLEKEGEKFKCPEWLKKNLNKQEISSPKAMISLEDLDKALEKYTLQQIEDINSEKLKALNRPRAMRMIIILAFFTGMRISEILKLRIEHVVYDDGFVLTIRESKTRNGIRNIPLSLLLPSKYAQEFAEYFSFRNTFGRNSTHLFYDLNHDVPFNDSTIRHEVRAIFESLGYVEFVFHHLRHSFSNWFCLRWFVAMNYQNQALLADLPFRTNDLFQPDSLERMRVLLLGVDDKKAGRDVFSYGLAALARILGHGGPVVTLKTYIHCTDLLFFLLSKQNQSTLLLIKPKQTMSFLQVTHPTYTKINKNSNKKLNLEPEVLLNKQRELLPGCYA